MKKNKIERIKYIIELWGSVNSAELQLDCSPCINSIGNGRNNVSQLIEHFGPTQVEAITYNDEIELGSEFIVYENLSDELIDEILPIIEEYNSQMELENS